MGHYLVVQKEIDPAERETYTDVFGPVTAVNPETAVKLSDASGDVIGIGPEYIIEVYELADDGTGRPSYFKEEELEL